jgi:hypothetical protein
VYFSTKPCSVCPSHKTWIILAFIQGVLL